MPTEVDAQLLVEEGGSPRNLRAGDSDGDFGVNTTGAAKESTLQALLTELGSKLEPSDVAALATAAKQDATEAVLNSILAAVDGLEGKDYATEAKLEAVRALLAGTLTVGVADALALDATVEAIRDRLPASLDNGSLNVADAYIEGETLASQAGAGGVLTFTLSEARDLVWVRSVGGVSYADPFGGTPANGTGIYLADDEPTPLTIRTAEVEVWAPSGAVVHCWGYGG
jgi:hypothetical protein